MSQSVEGRAYCPSRDFRERIELPPLNIRRWTARHKAAVVTAVAAGEITREEIGRRYQISEEELLSWERSYESYGSPGLRSTRLQEYRTTPRTAK
jgi:transposase-like protein